MERRLVAILAADVVGYSHFVEMDEAGTLAALKALRREVIDPLLAEHHGCIVKLMGDGALAEFGSVVDAVACAVAVQKGVADRQDGVPPERRTPDQWSRGFSVRRAAVFAALGRKDEAKAAVAVSTPDWSEAERQRLIETMRKAGFPACASPEAMATLAKPVRLPECPQPTAN